MNSNVLLMKGNLVISTLLEQKRLVECEMEQENITLFVKGWVTHG